MASDYVPNWSSKDGYRELIQNWYDGIIDTYKIERREMRIVRKDTNECFIWTAHRACDRTAEDIQCLGYVMFERNKMALKIVVSLDILILWFSH